MVTYQLFRVFSGGSEEVKDFSQKCVFKASLSLDTGKPLVNVDLPQLVELHTPRLGRAHLLFEVTRSQRAGGTGQ